MIEEPPDWLDDGPPHDDVAAHNGSNGRPQSTVAAEIRARAAQRKSADVDRDMKPDNVWIGTYDELAAMDLPEPAVITKMGQIKIVAAETVLIYGPSNLGKSLVALHTCIQAAAGGAHVLIVEGEGSKRALRERIRKLAAGMRASLEEIGPRITIAHGGFALGEQLEMWQQTLARAPFSAVMLDPLVSYFVGDENSSRDMQAFLDLVALARSGGSNVIVVHHATKPDAEGRSRERGSSALRAWADEVIMLARGDGPSTSVVAHEKSRERGVHPAPQNFTWTFSEAMIELDVDSAPSDAIDSAATKRHRTKLLGVLAEADGDVPTAEVRRQLGKISGSKLAEILVPMIKSGQVIRADVPRKDSNGRVRVTETLRLGIKLSSVDFACAHNESVPVVPHDDSNEFGG